MKRVIITGGAGFLGSHFCDLLIERDYGFNMWAYSRIDTCKPRYLEKLKAAGISAEVNGDEDKLFEQAVGWVIRAKQASTSMLQRRLKVGYSRTARILDLMEEKGIIGPPEGSKPRQVLVEPEEAGVSAGEMQEEK